MNNHDMDRAIKRYKKQKNIDKLNAIIAFSIFVCFWTIFFMILHWMIKR